MTNKYNNCFQLQKTTTDSAIMGSENTIVMIRYFLSFQIFTIAFFFFNIVANSAENDLDEDTKCQISYSCNSLDLHVESKVVEDTNDVCVAGLTVAAFFRDMGLPKELPTCVAIADSISSEQGMNTLGYFDPETKEIHILSFDTASNGGYWLGRSIDRALYRSLAAHEVAHALTLYNASAQKLSVRAREYVAYVAMFSTMDHNLRHEILADVSGSGFEKEEQISETYYYLSPYQFGVNAYRHFLRPENGARFFQSVIRGQALLELDN